MECVVHGCGWGGHQLAIAGVVVVGAPRLQTGFVVVDERRQEGLEPSGECPSSVWHVAGVFLLKVPHAMRWGSWRRQTCSWLCLYKGAKREDKVRVGTRGHRVEDMISDSYGLRLLGDSFGGSDSLESQDV